MFKKQIQNRITLSLILVAILIGQLGVLLFQAPPANAAGWDFNFLGGVLPEEVNGQVAEPNCTVDKMPITGKIVYSHPSPPRGGLTPVGLGDSIKIYIEMKPTVPNPPTGVSTAAPLKKLQENCARQAKEGILNFRLKIINYTGINTEDNYSYVAKLKSEPDGQLAANFPPIVLKNLTRINVIDGNKIGIRIAADFRGTNYKDIAEISFLAQQNPVTTLDTVPTGFETKESNTNPNNEVRKLADIALKTTMLDKYRVLYDEAAAFEQLKFGTNGLKAVSMDWIDPKSSLTRGNYVELPKEYDTSYWPDFTPLFNEFQTGFNYEEAVPKEGAGCVWDKGWVYNTVDCKKGVFINKSIYGDISTVKAGSLPVDSLDPVIYEKAWQDKKPADVTADGTTDKEGKPLYSVKMAHLPIMYLDKSSATAKDWAVLMNKNPAKFEIEVFNTAADIKAACIADGLAEDICNDPQKMRYSVGKEISTTSGTTATPAPTASQTLYAFIVRVISDIIVWLQSIIYRIFAYIVVPIINALLRVRPYQDAFVNVIYPGWLILRNIANIFFIVSLLVVGLRILFQQSAASAARGFIMRLIIMALLVNFSLVIGQGIIGIADTVQSQFLPGNTKIIEALGHKLMVEPLKNFRAEISGGSGNFDDKNSELALSDTIKPIVLLILSIAAFFSFVAIAAFLMVRLVALWVLYMLSPVAYVGFVMDETQKYAKQWWDEFIKYAIMTPVLVFFLNIAALMATVFSSGGDKGLFVFSDGSLSADIVVGSLTILTHFIVLIFIYAGMKFALGSGTAGAKSIVNYAKKGFDALTTRPAKWAAGAAKDAAVGAAQTQWDRRFKGGMLDPFAHRDAFKKSIDDKTKDKMDSRLAGKENKLTPTGLYKKPFKALKYVLSGGSLSGASMEKEMNALRNEARIMTKDEWDELNDAMPANEAAKKVAAAKLAALKKNRVSNSQVGEDILDKWEKKKELLSKERDSLDGQSVELDDKGWHEEAKEKRHQASLVEEDIAKLDAAITEVKDKVADAVSDGKSSIVLDGFDPKGETEAQIKLVFDAEDAKDKLKKEVEDLDSKLSALDKDSELKKSFGYKSDQYMDTNKRANLNAKASKMEEDIKEHYMPSSLGATNARLAREREQEKNIAHLEGEELRLAFKKAISENNTDLATAIGKKVAQEGDFDSLLKDYGFKNNAEEYTKFIDEKLGKLSPIVRAQIGSEISSLNKKNGNLALGDAYKVSNGHVIARPLEEQLRKVNSAAEKKSPDDVLKKGPNGLTYQTAKGHFINQGDIKNLNTFKGDKMKNLNKMNYKTAQLLTSAQNFSSLDSRIQDKIRSQAEGRDKVA